jgi:hypothetical protein
MATSVILIQIAVVIPRLLHTSALFSSCCFTRFLPPHPARPSALCAAGEDSVTAVQSKLPILLLLFLSTFFGRRLFGCMSITFVSRFVFGVAAPLIPLAVFSLFNYLIDRPT